MIFNMLINVFRYLPEFIVCFIMAKTGEVGFQTGKAAKPVLTLDFVHELGTPVAELRANLQIKI